MCKSILSGIGCLFLLFLIYGCALKNVEPGYTFDGKNGKSLVILSLTGSGTPKVDLFYRLKKVKLFYRFEGGSEFNSSEISVDGSNKLPGYTCGTEELRKIRINLEEGLFQNCHGRLVVIEVSPGDFVFDSVWIDECTLCGSAPWLLVNFRPIKLDMKFSVAPNQILYLGNIHFLFSFDDAAYKYRLFILPRNKKIRDMTVLKDNFPKIPVKLVETKIITQGSRRGQ